MSDIILGSEGLIGRAIHRVHGHAIGYSKTQLDITNYADLFSVFSGQRPKVVYLCAANSNVDACESINTGKVNVAGTMLVLRLCEMFDSKLVWFSSSYVFDGKSRVPYKEFDQPNPIQNYGVQKAMNERNIMSSTAHPLIIRTVGVFGEERGKKNFVKSVAASVNAGKKVFAPDDQYMNPVLSTDLAECVVRLADRHSGIYHVAGDMVVSKHDYAKMVADYFGKSRLVEAVSSDKLQQRAARPRMGALDCTELEETLGTIPSFEKGLSRFLEADYE